MPFPRPGTRAENFKDKTGSIDDLAGPCALQVALLDRRKCATNDDQRDLIGLDPIMDLINHAAAEQRRGTWSAERYGPHADDIQRNRMRQARRLFEKRVRAATTIGVGIAANDRLKYQRSRRCRAGFIRHRILACAQDEWLLNRLGIDVGFDICLVGFRLKELDWH